MTNCIDFQYKYLTQGTRAKRKGIDETFFESYSLIGVTERYVESMLILKYLLHLSWKDVMYISNR
eukprot:UN01385